MTNPELSSEQRARTLKYDWNSWARPSQIPPLHDSTGKQEWLKWLILAGRGWGKTRVGSETVRSWMCGDTPLSRGRFSRVAIVAETSADARLVIVEGESGANITVCFQPSEPPRLIYHKQTPDYDAHSNGAIAQLYSNSHEAPDQLR